MKPLIASKPQSIALLFIYLFIDLFIHTGNSLWFKHNQREPTYINV